MTPFRKNSTEHTKEDREKFNKYFSKYRVRIENCFGLLKEKFGSLKQLSFRMLTKQNKKLCNDWIMVCCILHNILQSLKYDESSTETFQPNFIIYHHQLILEIAYSILYKIIETCNYFYVHTYHSCLVNKIKMN